MGRDGLFPPHRSPEAYNSGRVKPLWLTASWPASVAQLVASARSFRRAQTGFTMAPQAKLPLTPTRTISGTLPTPTLPLNKPSTAQQQAKLAQQTAASFAIVYVVVAVVVLTLIYILLWQLSKHHYQSSVWVRRNCHWLCGISAREDPLPRHRKRRAHHRGGKHKHGKAKQQQEKLSNVAAEGSQPPAEQLQMPEDLELGEQAMDAQEGSQPTPDGGRSTEEAGQKEGAEAQMPLGQDLSSPNGIGADQDGVDPDRPPLTASPEAMGAGESFDDAQAAPGQPSPAYAVIDPQPASPAYSKHAPPASRVPPKSKKAPVKLEPAPRGGHGHHARAAGGPSRLRDRISTAASSASSNSLPPMSRPRR